MKQTAPRVLVICTDQQRWDSLGCYGAGEVSTPNIDGLADAGTMFERCYTTNPVCAPARASMLTGVYPYQHGLWANGVKLPGERVTVLRNLAEAGYHTGQVGKLHLSPCCDGRTEDPGEYGFAWNRWSHGPPQAAPGNSYHRWLADRYPALAAEAAAATREDLSRPGGGPRAYQEFPAQGHYSTWVGEAATEFINSTPQDQPWMLWVNFFDPHHPFGAPAEYVERVGRRHRRPPVGSPADLVGRPAQLRELSARSYAGHARGFGEYTPEEVTQLRIRYWAMIDLVDEQVGRILRAAEATGPVDDLVVLFLSDHGEMLGDHGLLLKGPMLYEGATRVPCIVRWPGRVPASGRVAGLVSLADVAATLADVAGISPPSGSWGRSLVGVADGSLATREVAMVEYRNSGHPYEPPVSTTMVTDGHHKVVAWHQQSHPPTGTPTGEFYDLDTDPDEMHNRWDDPSYAEVRTRLMLAMAGELALPSAGWGEREANF